MERLVAQVVEAADTEEMAGPLTLHQAAEAADTAQTADLLQILGQLLREAEVTVAQVESAAGVTEKQGMELRM